MVGKFEGGTDNDKKDVVEVSAEEERKEKVNYYYTPEAEALLEKSHTKITAGQVVFGGHYFEIGEVANVVHTDYETPKSKPHEVTPGASYTVPSVLKLLRAYQDNGGAVTHAVFEVRGNNGEQRISLTETYMLLKTEDIKLKTALKGMATPLDNHE